MRTDHVLTALRLAVLVPMVLIVSDMLTSIAPLTAFLGGLGIAAPETLIRLGVAALVGFIVLNGESPGWLISLSYFANMLYLIMRASPLVETAFPTLYPPLMDALRENVLLPTSRAFFYIPVLVVVSIVDDYIGELLEKERIISEWEIPAGDVAGVVYPSLLVMAVAMVTSALVFLWAIDYLTGRRVDLGELYYLAPPLLLLALGMSFSMGIFGRGKARRNVLVIKARMPLGRSYSWKIEGGDDLVVTVLTRGGEMREREIRIETEVKEPPKRVILYVKNLGVGEGEDSTKRVPLRKVKESTDGDTRFLLYTNMWPVEF
ncbi:hypothetical protein [Thermococcus aciditolerans]|uniref:Uncharacterized protein n=1 Tax=Thermococcus aciditolerans TaxID=2598455 RepID=A0A5C0SKU4_9EURY|nr:hypothetical protein [Thermococcus aciditolerans]QEK14034.1 hypothetical protein FPV09_01635 [Thermococcus aciditolerans]